MELYNELTDMPLTEQIPDETITIPEHAETEPDVETPAPLPAARLPRSLRLLPPGGNPLQPPRF